MANVAFLALVILLALGFYVAARGLRLKHQREIIARLEDLRLRHEQLVNSIRSGDQRGAELGSSGQISVLDDAAR